VTTTVPVRDISAFENETPLEFRERLRKWLHSNVDSSARQSFSNADRKRVSAGLYDEGLLGMTWPQAYGGRGLPSEYQTIWNEEAVEYNWAVVNSSVTVGICAPTLFDYGTEEQKLRHLPRMLRGDEFWTQLLSEPGAGSDLASVSTAAIKDGDQYTLNGQKVWTSSAGEADYALALVRTDPEVKRHGGVSMLIVDVKSAGIDIRPLREMTGNALFNEVFMDDVQIPADNLVGELNGGWEVLIRMLTHERIALSAGTTGGRMDEDSFPKLLALARWRKNLDEPEVREALTEIYIQQRLLDYTGIRMREAIEAGISLGPVGSIGKIGTAKAARYAGEAAVLIGGMRTLAWKPEDTESEALARAVLHFPMTGIAGGTTEIQKNTVAERVLGLPREPRPT
jgi:alkylation response protein AidB-like acyl-CoA dehydrogenase